METVASKQWKELSALEGKLVDELSLTDSNDTLGKWMAHYLAELFNEEEKSKGSAKKTIRIECVDVILKIWSHRKAFPSSYPPLESFDEIIEVIKKLRKDEPYYFGGLHEKEEAELPKDVMLYLNLATKIDKTARKLVNILINRSIQNAAIENKEWLKNALSFVNPTDQQMNIAIELMGSVEGIEQDSHKKHEELYRSMIEFGEMCLEVGSNGLESLK